LSADCVFYQLQIADCWCGWLQIADFREQKGRNLAELAAAKEGIGKQDGRWGG
jgi:hypothetical protein